MKIAIDTSLLVGLINPRDLWHEQATALRDALLDADGDLVYFDCVVTEAISTLARRLHERGLVAEVQMLADRLNDQVPDGLITWILPDVPRLYRAALGLIRSSSGALNFNDALIALACRERGIPAIASFDTDFDDIPWLRRLARPEDVTP